MRFLRTVSTRRLLAAIAGLMVAIAAGTAIAVAASGNGPVSSPSQLAPAIHKALAAPAVPGISARITFTNNLISANDIQGADPLLNGASGRLWLSNDHQLRLELQGLNGDAQLVVDNGSFWVYDPTSHTAYEGKLPADKQTGKTKSETVPTIAQIQTDLNQLMQHLNVVGPRTGDIGGQPAYTIRVSPKHDGGLIGAAQLAWDSARGVPLAIGVYARNDNTPVLQLKATDISFGRVSSSVFAITAPRGAKIVTVSTPTSSGTATTSSGKLRKGKQRAEVTGVAAVARHLSFGLVAPAKLVGVRRQSVSLLNSNGSSGALVTYGQNLGGIVVIEQPQQAQSAPTQSGSGDQLGLSLPSVSIAGATGQELDTALGTVVRFSRAGVTFTVLGSVPAVAADDAARALAAQTR